MCLQQRNCIYGSGLVNIWLRLQSHIEGGREEKEEKVKIYLRTELQGHKVFQNLNGSQNVCRFIAPYKIPTTENAELPLLLTQTDPLIFCVLLNTEMLFLMFTRCSRFLICSILRSVDLSTTTDSKQFQELLLERTKAFAAQTEALKSSNSDGKLFSLPFICSYFSLISFLAFHQTFVIVFNYVKCIFQSPIIFNFPSNEHELHFSLSDFS